MRSCVIIASYETQVSFEEMGFHLYALKEINLLQSSYSKSPDPTIAKSISNLQNAQDKLYTSLVKHGVTAKTSQD